MVWMNHSLFIHSSTEGHLGCFQVLAIINKAAVNNMSKFLCGHMFSFLLDITFAVETVLQSGCLFYIPTSNVWGLHFLHIFTNTYFLSFYDSHPSEAISHCGFGLHFLNANNVEHFSCAYWPFLYLLWWNVCLNSLCTFNWVIHFVTVEL